MSDLEELKGVIVKLMEAKEGGARGQIGLLIIA